MTVLCVHKGHQGGDGRIREGEEQKEKEKQGWHIVPKVRSRSRTTCFNSVRLLLDPIE